jgi:hypothetical protein
VDGPGRGRLAERHGDGTGSLVVDTSAPSITSISPDGSVVNQFSPNADGVADTITTTATPSEAGSIAVRVADDGNTTVRTFVVASSGGAVALTWDGKANGGTVVPDGEYTITMAARDGVGNSGPGKARTVRVVTLLGSVAASAGDLPQRRRPVFAPSSTPVVRSSPRAAPDVDDPRRREQRRLHPPRRGVAAGRIAELGLQRPEAGRDDAAARDGITSYVSADGTFSWAQSTRIELNAFSVTPSTTAPKRGKLTSPRHRQTLTGSPKLYDPAGPLDLDPHDESKVDSKTAAHGDPQVRRHGRHAQAEGLGQGRRRPDPGHRDEPHAEVTRGAHGRPMSSTTH